MKNEQRMMKNSRTNNPFPLRGKLSFFIARLHSFIVAKRRVFFILHSSLFIAVLPLAAQQDILDRAAALYNNAKGVTLTFTMHTDGAGGTRSEAYEGSLMMQGDKFALMLPGMMVWYDGTTQWTYREGVNEVNITEPAGEELRNTNPLLLLRSYKEDYKATFKGESTADSGKTAYEMELVPRKRGVFSRVLLQMEVSTAQPVRIVLEAKDGSRTTIRIQTCDTSQALPPAAFAFDAKQYPDAEVIDLR